MAAQIPFDLLQQNITGELVFDCLSKTIYATDASDFKEMPLGVCFPKTEKDIQAIIRFAQEHHFGIIPRGAGTSLAGQVVGNGLIVDVSKYMNAIIEINVQEKWAIVQPGIVRDELNMALKQYGLFFGPETSTANRATIGGMVGNNACGSNSIVYGSTREHLLAVYAVLSDASFATFESCDEESIKKKIVQQNLEGKIYESMLSMLQPEEVQNGIEKEFPKASITRRNTGYALDQLLQLQPFKKNANAFNFCQLLAGSEGTLAFATALKVNLIDLPPSENALLCIHCTSIHEATIANIECVAFQPYGLELIDHYILECTKNNLAYQPYLFFVESNPKGILIAEFRFSTQTELQAHIQKVIQHLQEKKLGYHYSVVEKKDVSKVWSLRKAGLGLLANIPGDEKAVAVIEDTAVDIHDLPQYIAEFNAMLTKYNLYAVHYAHIGTGELHLRPLLNLKTKSGQELYRTVATEIAHLVKKYQGSLSGEHGDGRLRGEFLQTMVGEKNYNLFIDTKTIWDKNNILNPHKIVHTPKMDESLRYAADYPYPVYKTYFRYQQGDLLRDVQQCNGSGDCRKSHLSGGTMCPSYMATKNESQTTRARANLLREVLSNADAKNAFDSKELYDILDLCLSCKGCKSECPSNVDMAKMKAEFLQQYYATNRMPLRSKLIANFSSIMNIASKVAPLYNFFNQAPIISNISKAFIGFAQKRSLPKVHSTTLLTWFRQFKKNQKKKNYHAQVFLFCDEFTNYLDVHIGQQTILLLEGLGYEVRIPEHVESGRSLFSKGFLAQAQMIANKNVALLSNVITEKTPLIGIEPSCILSFRDEYPDLVSADLIQKSKTLAQHTLLIDEFIVQEFEAGRIRSTQFATQGKHILLHGHCQQKAVAKIQATEKMLQIANHTVQTLASGCCGMAGSFGYEKEHYDLSMQIGELVLFPSIRNAKKDTVIVAYGTSCRHQIKDGTKQASFHPVEVLLEQLAPETK